MPQTSERSLRTSPQLDGRSARSAQIRAIAVRLVDSPRLSRRFHVPAGVPLTGSSRRRRSGGRAAMPRRDLAAGRSPAVRRRLAAVLLLLQAVGLVVLFTAPVFRVHTVDVTGTRLLSRTALLEAAAVPQTSVFAVDSNAIRRRLTSVPWVHSVDVSTQLPSTVVIDVTEWTPDLVYHGVASTSFVASSGATLAIDASDVARVRGLPIAIDERSPSPPLLAGMPDLLAAIARQWHGLFSTDVAAFAWSSGGILSIWSVNGWAAVLGSTDSNAEVAAIPGEIAALAALRGKLDFASPTFGYVNLENPTEPAVGGHPGIPPDIRAGILAATTVPVAPAPAAARPVPAATPAPSSSPAPPPASPTPSAPAGRGPVTFVLPQPSPTPRGSRP
ncbi:MAG: cell division protein FtsQ/DivIB [Candidatus Dormibacteria bacterium]